MSYTLEIFRYDEIPVPGMRLGRHICHDSRSLAYPYPAGAVPVTSCLWARNTPILNQGDVGSCTGNAITGALGCDPDWADLPPGHPALDEAEALALYSAAEDIDGDGPYPPNDNGSYGLSVCKAAVNAGLISGYTHCMDVPSVLQALMAGPVILGIDWYDSFDSPAADGTVSIAPGAVIRGGHEIVARGVDTLAQVIEMDNSWGTSWGLDGSFRCSFDTLAVLLADGGDCTVPVPLTAPAPVPVPPVPVPPGPQPGPDTDPADLALFTDPRIARWVRERHAGDNRHAARAVLACGQAKGLMG